MSVSVNRLGTFAILRSQFEHRERGACFGIDLAVVPKTPPLHFVGVNDDFLDAISQLFEGEDLRADQLQKFDVTRRIVTAADFGEPGIILRVHPYDSGDLFVHGDFISVSVAESEAA